MRIALFVFILSLCLGSNRIVHINSTYYDGTPKQIIIYEYSSLYKNNPLNVIDVINFDKNGNILFEFDNYFNSRWELFVDDSTSFAVEIYNNEFRFLKPSQNCLDCYLSSKWDLTILDDNISVLAQSDITKFDPSKSYMLYNIEIVTKNEFLLKSPSKSYKFIR